MTKAFVGLGSNLGEREAQIRRALEELGKLPRTKVLRVSSLYDTEPVGEVEQPRFLNAVACVDTELTAGELLWNLLLVEQRLGRVRAKVKKWGPRTIDLDLLFFGDLVAEEPGLTVPHPEAHLRAFVLAPLAELEPDFVHPILGETIAAILSRLPKESGVRKGGRLWP
ncbi:MAG TPA: 2-amino-4-hydroxy-6-hydroxymethyldihydropteridine diphosphokinase [Candidatus Eisenbacteria bacterium]